MRDGKEIRSIDFYDFLLSGEKNNDIDLQDNDVVFIGQRSKTVTVIGEVARNYIFEFKSGETFKDLKKIMGGYLSTTYMKRARLDRIIDFKNRNNNDADREIIDLSILTLEKNNDFEILDGDKFTFFKISDKLRNNVVINGPLKRPGSYSIGNSLKVSELIKKADGFINSDIYKDKFEITRILSNGKQELISLNLDSVQTETKNHDIKLREKDVVEFYSLSDRLYSSDVSIEGFVLNPGKRKWKTGMTVFDLIFSAGGFDNLERLDNTYMDRADYYSFDELQ